jgi:archaellum component FlaG (FlaF/FlaG flagellin family)
LASAALSVSGTSVYDGSVLNVNNGDVTFYLDPSATTINIDGQQVRRTTVETIDNPNGVVPAPAPTQTQQPAP